MLCSPNMLLKQGYIHSRDTQDIVCRCISQINYKSIISKRQMAERIVHEAQVRLQQMALPRRLYSSACIFNGTLSAPCCPLGPCVLSLLCLPGGGCIYGALSAVDPTPDVTSSVGVSNFNELRLWLTDLPIWYSITQETYADDRVSFGLSVPVSRWPGETAPSLVLRLCLH